VSAPQCYVLRILPVLFKTFVSSFPRGTGTVGVVRRPRAACTRGMCTKFFYAVFEVFAALMLRILTSGMLRCSIRLGPINLWRSYAVRAFETSDCVKLFVEQRNVPKARILKGFLPFQKVLPAVEPTHLPVHRGLA
jgi:hypothetical protein